MRAPRLRRLPVRAMGARILLAANDAAPRRFYNQFVVPEPLPPFPARGLRWAALSATHPSKSYVSERPYRAQRIAWRARQFLTG